MTAPSGIILHTPDSLVLKPGETSVICLDAWAKGGTSYVSTRAPDNIVVEDISYPYRKGVETKQANIRIRALRGGTGVLEIKTRSLFPGTNETSGAAISIQIKVGTSTYEQAPESPSAARSAEEALVDANREIHDLRQLLGAAGARAKRMSSKAAALETQLAELRTLVQHGSAEIHLVVADPEEDDLVRVDVCTANPSYDAFQVVLSSDTEGVELMDQSYMQPGALCRLAFKVTDPLVEDFVLTLTNLELSDQEGHDVFVTNTPSVHIIL